MMNSPSMRDLLLEYGENEQNGIEELTEIDFSCKKLSLIEPDILNQCTNLKVLNLSKNRIKSLSGMCLPNLEVLNFEDNLVSDVTFLSDVPAVRKLYFDGNPLNAADRYIAADILKNLEIIDGKNCNDIHKVLAQFQLQLNGEATRLYIAKYRLLMESTSNFDEIVQYRRGFVREVSKKLPSFLGVPPKFQRYKVQCSVDILFSKGETKTPTKSSKPELSTPRSVSKQMGELQLQTPSPTKRKLSAKEETTPSTALRSLRISSSNSAQEQTSDIHLATPNLQRKKRRRLNLGSSANEQTENGQLTPTINGGNSVEQCLDYEPEIFLRCHVPYNDPDDCGTQVWAAAFEIDIKDESKTTDVLATCGRNVVCFINCSSGHVLKRYKCESENEDLYALDWSVLPYGQQKAKTTILATAGLKNKIHLIHPKQLKCYYMFKAHSKIINCLRFHPVERSWLFSGGEDFYIHLWDIGAISLHDYSHEHKKLMTFEASNKLTQMELLSTYNCLIASSENELAVWDLNHGPKNWKRKSSVILKLPRNCKSNGKGVIDGLSIITDTCIAVKESCSGKIGLFLLNHLFPDGQLIKKSEFQLSPAAVLLWSDCDLDYIYTNSCKSEGLLASGDDCGRLWLYDARFHLNKKKTHKKQDDPALPTTVLPWPNLLFEQNALSMRPNVVINSLGFNWNGDYIVACTNSNLVCIWKKK